MRWDRIRLPSITSTVFLAVTLAFGNLAWAGGTYKVLHGFTGGSDGGGVFAGVVADSGGNLYGVTTGGGAFGSGTAFKLGRSSSGHWSKTILHSFCSPPHCADGGLPSTTPILDTQGNVYGTSNIATFQLVTDLASAIGWSFQVIYDTGSEGLLMDRAGNLYGEWGPGKYEGLDVFELEHGADGWTEKVLYNFCPHRPQCRDGLLPQYGLTWDAAGNLYGVTTEGGVNKGGVAFQLEHTAEGWKEHVLHSFPASRGDGYPPSSGLTLDDSGNLYGITEQGGGSASGTVFRLSRQPDGRWKETILYFFPNGSRDGEGPAAGLVFDKAGNLYGTTSGGGDSKCSCGVVFKMTPQPSGKWKYTVLHRFNGADGWVPQAGVTLDDKGNLYGTTTEGGPGGYGVVFEITP